MLGHFGVRFKVFGRGLKSRCRQGRKKYFFFIFLSLWFRVVGSIPGVDKVENWNIVGKTYLSIDKKDFVA